jgi:hypothetical protein
VDYAKKQEDPTIPRAWSRYTKGSSAYAITHKDEMERNKRERKAADKDKLGNEEVEEKK